MSIDGDEPLRIFDLGDGREPVRLIPAPAPSDPVGR